MRGFVVVLILPDHEEKAYPDEALAVRVTWVPAIKLVPFGNCAIDPAFAGEVVAVSVGSFGIPLAVTAYG